MFVEATSVGISMFSNKEMFEEACNFCKSLYEPVVARSTYLTAAFSNSVRFIKVFKSLSALSFLSTILAGIASQYMAGSNFPLPLPYQVPFIGSNNLFGWIVTLLNQTLVRILIIVYHFLLAIYSFQYFAHLLSAFDVLTAVIDDLDGVRRKSSFTNWTAAVTLQFSAIKR